MRKNCLSSDPIAVAPMGGELDTALYGGGIEELNPPRYIAFGRMLSRGSQEYTLTRISRSYTSFTVATAKSAIYCAKAYASEALACGFRNINKLLIHFARTKQLGVAAFSEEEYGELLRKFNGLIQFYYFLALFGKHIRINYELYHNVSKALRDSVIDCPELRLKFEKKLESICKFNGHDNGYTYENFIMSEKTNADNICASILAHLTFEKIIQKIIDWDLNIKNIYDNPTEEGLTLALSILQLPKTSSIFTGFMLDKLKEVVLAETQFFTLEPTVLYDSENFYSVSDLDNYITNRGVYKLQALLCCFFEKQPSTSTFQTLEKMALNHVDILIKKMAVLKKIAEIDIEKVKFSQEERIFIKNPFPVIMICNSEDKIGLCKFATQEYRTQESLKLGEEITIIATDTLEHQLLIIKFLEESLIQNVQVVLIDQLHQSKIDGKPPKSFYTHSDGIPKLSFFAAKAVPGHLKIADKKLESIVNAAKEYQKLTCPGVI